MQIICENCEKSYNINESKVPPNGAATKCSTCGSKILIGLPGTQTDILSGSDTNINSNKPDTNFSTDKIQNSKSRSSSKIFKYLLNKKETNQIIGDLRSIKFKNDIIPIDGRNISILKRDFVFWSVVLLGITPLFLISINNSEFQLTAFAIFFAVIWGVIFKMFVVEDTGEWKFPLLASLFTGIIGLNVLGFVYKIFPSLYASDNIVISLFGYVFLVGILEELCKIAPVLFYLLWKRKNADYSTIIIIGIFSGLGFAAFENTSYYNIAIVKTYLNTAYTGIPGLVHEVRGAMVTVMLRSVSLVFCHATWAGIFAYFIALGHFFKKRRIALFIVGLSVSALIHGVYNWFCGIQNLLGALIVGFSFMLFYAYKTKLRFLLSQ